MKVATAISKTVGASGAAAECLKSLQAQMPAQDVKLVFVFASTSQPMQALLPLIQKGFPQAVVLGSTTSGEFTEAHEGKDGCVVLAVSGDIAVEAGFASGLSKGVENAVAHAVKDLPKGPTEGYAHRTGVILVDPLSGFGEEAALLCAVMLEGDIPLAGGAAGDDLKMDCAMVGLGEEVARDSIVVAHISSHVPLAIGVSHDHRPVSPTLTITKAEGSRIFEVDGEPAWDVWKKFTRDPAKAQGIDVDNLTHDEEGAYLLRFEAGLAIGTNEWKVRAPLARDADGSLLLATAIPQGAKICITESTPKRQIDSARKAAERAKAQLNGTACAGAVVFDCICRNLILGGDFKQAVDAIGNVLGGVPLGGIETYGEIALHTQDLSAFHNTTTVILAFPEEK